MTTYTFTGPSTSRRHTGTCPGCRKKVTRSRTFSHTVNPFNCVGEGDDRREKTWPEVAADVKVEADAWRPDFTCQACESAADIAGASVDRLISWIHTEGSDRYRLRNAGKKSRAELCNQRMAIYAAQIVALEPERVEWPTTAHYNRETRAFTRRCYYEFPDQQRCIYGARHGGGIHLSPTGLITVIGAPKTPAVTR